MDINRKINFLEELKDLLEKYNVEMDVDKYPGEVEGISFGFMGESLSSAFVDFNQNIQFQDIENKIKKLKGGEQR